MVLASIQVGQLELHPRAKSGHQKFIFRNLHNQRTALSSRIFHSALHQGSQSGKNEFKHFLSIKEDRWRYPEPATEPFDMVLIHIPFAREHE